MKRSCRGASEISGQTEHVYGECRYATRKTWPWKTRVIYKAEGGARREQGTQPQPALRGHGTQKQSPQWIYEKGLLSAGRRGEQD